MIDGAYAILLISTEAGRLARFYREVVGLDLVDEIHDDIPLHYGCELGSVHFAIHPAEGWPGRPIGDAQSPVICLRDTDVNASAKRLRGAGWTCVGPHDHGFALSVSFRDPDGNAVQLMQPN